MGANRPTLGSDERPKLAACRRNSPGSCVLPPPETPSSRCRKGAGSFVPNTTLIDGFGGGRQRLFPLGCDKSVTDKRRHWPRMASDRGRGIAVKYRIALAVFFAQRVPCVACAAALRADGSSRPGPFMVRQPVEWTVFYFGANAGYG